MAELSSTELSAHAIIQRLELHARTHHFSGTDDLADKFLQECDELVHEWESGPKDQLKRGEVQKYFKREITLRELLRKLKHIEPEEFDDMYDGLPPDAQRHTTKTKVHRPAEITSVTSDATPCKAFMPAYAQWITRWHQ